ncbi:MAG: dihydrodipicolinate synthase family protein [Clostridiales bacterium]|nr:dihydrodipicolinate synthase family protein [Clostridiales bacterium]
MNENKNIGLWPVMLTPFTDEGEVDYASLERLIEWYEKGGATGLFACCQSSEIFFLSLRERAEIARFVVSHAHVPVIASGHVSDGFSDQLEELKAVASTGVEALILITNRLVGAGRQGESIMPRVEMIAKEIPDIPLGFYECPYPFKRLITLEELERCRDMGRFRFMKDTCCDIDIITERLGVLNGSDFALYNANTTTLLESVRRGAAGFSGVMLSFHPVLYKRLFELMDTDGIKADELQSFLTMFSEIERQYYPVNAKHFLKGEGVLTSAYTRTKPAEGLTPTFVEEVRQLKTAQDMLIRMY